ncbi:MAG TPA: hypothetical protein VGN22_01085 [Pseudonocardia sp.]|jgi:hypothetical protein
MSVPGSAVRGMGRAALADAVADVVGTSVAAQESVVVAFALVEALGTEARRRAHPGSAATPTRSPRSAAAYRVRTMERPVCLVTCSLPSAGGGGLLELRRREGGEGGRRS